MVVVPADGRCQKETYLGEEYFTEENDVFPLRNVTSFNKDFKTSDKIAKKAAQFFTKNTNGTYWIDSSVENITQNEDGTISFDFVAEYDSSNSSTTTGVPESALFYESFDGCDGTGANDDNWGSSVAGNRNKFLPDNEGWSSDAYYGGYQCARFGSGKVVGTATSPLISLTGNSHVVTFKAAAWGSDGTNLKLSATGATVLIEPSEFTMVGSEWTTFTAKISGTGDINLVFTPVKRFFLDEVVVMDEVVQTGISATPATSANQTRIYTLDGRYAGTDINTLKHGIYIINGKKVIK
jgi:hypothetical protein